MSVHAHRLAACLVLAALLAPAAPSHAQVANGGFETAPAFSGWSTDGDAAVVTASFGQAPSEGSNQAFISNSPLNPPTDTVDTAAGLETFLGLDAGRISGFSGTPNPLYTAQNPTDGSAIKQTIVAHAGDVLSFQYDFLTSEDPANAPPYYPDYAFLTLSGAATQTVKEVSESALATVPTPNDPSLPIYNYLTETGYLPFVYTFTAAGTYTLGFASTQTNGSGIGSALLVDNVTLTPAPEPSALAALALGIVCVGGLAARRRTTGVR